MYIMHIDINNLKIPKSYIEEGLTIQRSKEKKKTIVHKTLHWKRVNNHI